MKILKIIRWVLTALFAVLVLVSEEVSPMVIALLLLVAAVWVIPALTAREREHQAPRAFREHFNPDIQHGNIALDTASDTLWIRDASGEERYLRRSEMLAWKTAHDWNNGTFRQRIEIDVRDVQRPRWHVLFQRHSDTFVKSSKRNGEERDEWFARLRAWSQRTPSTT